MPFINVGESKIYYEDYGAGPAVILAHGVGGNHASWYNQIPTFSKEFRVIAYDHRGFGNSTDAEGLGRAAFISDLAALLDGLGLERAILVGQSMGGGTAAAFTCRYPERVIGLLHCDSLAAVKLDEPYSSELEAVNKATYNFSQVERVLGATTRAERPELSLLYVQIASFNSVSLKTLKGAAAPWRPEELAKSGVPVAFVAGEEDVICPPSLIRVLHEQTPNSLYCELKRSGHSAYFETPAAFNDFAMGFLRSLI